MKKVFLSYSSKDQKTAAAICQALEVRGHPCWMSTRDVKPGENFQGAIVRAIREAGVMVMIFSTNANNSDEIKKEMALASQCKLMVIPVRAEDVLPSEDFTYELATRQWIDLFDDWEQAMDRIGGQVDAVLPRALEPWPACEIETPAAKAQVQAPKPAESNRLRVALIFGGVLVAFGVVAAVGLALRSKPAPAPVQQQAAAVPAPKPVVQPAAQSGMDPAKLESDLWDSVKDSGDAAALNSYLAKYPGGMFAAAAKAKLAALNKPAAPPVKAAAEKPAAPVVQASASPPATVMPMSMPMPMSQPAMGKAGQGALNGDVQMAVDMARSAETRAREMAENGEQMFKLAQAGTPGFGFETAHGLAKWGGRLAAFQQGGVGVITYANGDRYAGGTREGDRFGVGVYTGAPARIYRERVGEFAGDELNGYAVVYRKDGKVRVGQWKDGVMSGYGALYDAQGRVLEQGMYAKDKLAAPLN
jgi:hypothetical protein